MINKKKQTKNVKAEKRPQLRFVCIQISYFDEILNYAPTISKLFLRVLTALRERRCCLRRRNHMLCSFLMENKKKRRTLLRTKYVF